MKKTAKGILLVVSAPSGAGKTTLCKRLVAENENVEFSVSHTTRRPRPGEIDGQAYHFVDEQRFKAMIDEGAFAEWAKVFDNYYGTSFEAIRNGLENGVDLTLDIDVQGARQIKDKFPESVAVFILPPSTEELKRRLAGRGTEDDDTRAKRLSIASRELREADNFDYLVVNDDLDKAYEKLRAILIGERCRLVRALVSERKLLEELGVFGNTKIC